MAKPRAANELDDLTGNQGHREKPKPAPVAVPADLPMKGDDAPDQWLGGAPKFLQGEARAIWDRASPIMVRLNLLQSPDSIAFARYCQWLARFVALEKSGGKRRVVETTKSRAVKMERLDKTFQALTIIDKRLMDYEDRFGMNPRERQSILEKLATGAGRPPQQPQPPADRPTMPTETATRSPVGFLQGRNSKLN